MLPTRRRLSEPLGVYMHSLGTEGHQHVSLRFISALEPSVYEVRLQP